jgi:hypothetical protein
MNMKGWQLLVVSTRIKVRHADNVKLTQRVSVLSHVPLYMHEQSSWWAASISILVSNDLP